MLGKEAPMAVDTEPVVTIVIPCYKHAHYLDECLSSIIAQTFDIGHQDEGVGRDQIAHQCSEQVIVTVFDLLDRHRIIFIDNRHDASVEQSAQGVASVEEAPAVGDIVVGQEKLGNADVVSQEAVLPIA